MLNPMALLRVASCIGAVHCIRLTSLRAEGLIGVVVCLLTGNRGSIIVR